MSEFKDFYTFITEMHDKLNVLLFEAEQEREAYKEAIKILKRNNTTAIPLDKVIERLEINIEEE